MVKPLIPKPMDGFTLAELLIAMFILGVISTFTIPKVLTAQNNQKNNAIAKETAAILSGALMAYELEGNTVQSSTTMGALRPYINYVKIDTSTTVDDISGNSAVACSDTNATCLKLPSGAMLWYWNYVSFNGTGNNNAIFIHLDPDGITSSSKAINFFIYANGKLRDEGTIETSTVSSDNTRNPLPGNNPSWWNGW